MIAIFVASSTQTASVCGGMTLKDGAEPKVGMRPFYATYGRQVCFVMPIVQLCLGAFLFILLRVVALKVAQRIKSEKPEVEAAME